MASGYISTAYVDRGLEGAVAVAQQHGDVVGSNVRDGQVEAAVAVEIARDLDSQETAPTVNCWFSRERAVAVAQQDRDLVRYGSLLWPGRGGRRR